MNRIGNRGISVGDWVTSHSPGVWQVMRSLGGFYELRYSLDERKRISKRTIVFLKRLVGHNWAPAFKAESCDVSLVQPLGNREMERLRGFISGNPDILSDFESFAPPTLDFMFELRLNLRERISMEALRDLVGKTFVGLESEGLTNEDVLRRIGSSALAALRSADLSDAALRFVCRDHETRDGEFVFRAAEVLGF